MELDVESVYFPLILTWGLGHSQSRHFALFEAFEGKGLFYPAGGWCSLDKTAK
jgi:hypothetical protein